MAIDPPHRARRIAIDPPHRARRMAIDPPHRACGMAIGSARLTYDVTGPAAPSPSTWPRRGERPPDDAPGRGKPRHTVRPVEGNPATPRARSPGGAGVGGGAGGGGGRGRG